MGQFTAKLVGVVLAAVLLSTQVWAQDSSTTSPAEGETSSSVSGNKKFHENPDITEAKIRAENGSLSRWSSKFDFSYYGPPVGDLSNPMQPNPDGSVGNYATALSGSLGLRYRLDNETAISAGSGIKSVKPFQELKRFDVNTPFVSYDKVFRLGRWQSLQSFGTSLTTTPEYRDVGEIAGLTYVSSWYTRIGTSRYLIGLDSDFGYYFYNRAYERADRSAERYNWGIYPTLKYHMTDKLGIYTSYAFDLWNARRLTNAYALLSQTQSARLGFEYAFTHDIYFAPYLNFYPESFSWASTTVNFFTVFSIL